MVTASPAAVITGFGTALPETTTQASLWQGFFSQHFDHRRSAKLAFSSAGVTTRHAAVNPLNEDISLWSTGARMERYLTEAMPLGKEALAGALNESNLAPEDLGMFIVVSCTGYATPGLDARLARDLGMSPSVERVNIGHVGCHAALPALGLAHDYVVSHGRPAMLLCLELSSLHIQPPSRDLGQAIVHSLFSDAATAIVVAPEAVGPGVGLEVIDRIVCSNTASIEAMTWNITDFGFRMTLSRHVSDVVGNEVGPLVGELLARNSLSLDEVGAWAVHPGGPRILDEVADRLNLDESDLFASRSVLAAHGNCSSATILLVIDAVRQQLGDRKGQNIVALAFGPGLTLCATLLRTV